MLLIYSHDGAREKFVNDSECYCTPDAMSVAVTCGDVDILLLGLSFHVHNHEDFHTVQVIASLRSS